MRIDWLLLQLSDSALPTGGFAHSGGLEALVQQGELGNNSAGSGLWAAPFAPSEVPRYALRATRDSRGPSTGDLRCFLRNALWQAGHFGVPLVAAAHENPEALARLDARADAFLASHVANRASRTQGRAFLDTCARIFPDLLFPLREVVRRDRLRQHYAPLFGAVLRTLQIERPVAQQLFLSLSLRGLLFAAVRLGLVGTHEAQRLLHDFGPMMDEVLEACADLRDESLAQTFPLADLVGSMHDRLYSRLFQS